MPFSQTTNVNFPDPLYCVFGSARVVWRILAACGQSGRTQNRRVGARALWDWMRKIDILLVKTKTNFCCKEFTLTRYHPNKMILYLLNTRNYWKGHIKVPTVKSVFSICSLPILNAPPSLPLPSTRQREGGAFMKPFEHIGKTLFTYSTVNSD